MTKPLVFAGLAAVLLAGPIDTAVGADYTPVTDARLTNPEPAKFHAHVIIRTPNGNDYGFELLRQYRENAK